MAAPSTLIACPSPARDVPPTCSTRSAPTAMPEATPTPPRMLLTTSTPMPRRVVPLRPTVLSPSPALALDGVRSRDPPAYPATCRHGPVTDARRGRRDGAHRSSG